jgi:uncharacterized protein (DUF488 family)
VNPAIATIGFGKKGAERFVDLLQGARVDTVVDTRRRPDSPLSGYARQRDLPYLLGRAAGIGYEHRPELAPSESLLDRYRKDKDWPAYVRDFEDVLTTSDAQVAMQELIDRSRTAVLALLCSEPEPDRCHRRLVAERMQEMEPSLRIHHLV